MSDIVDTTISLIGSLLRKDQIQLTVEIEPDLPLLKCQSQQIEQILINLLTNARDALNDRYPDFDEDKILRVTVDVIHREDKAWIRTIVEDHGSGISADIIDRIFDPFFSTKPREKGTGLGLSVSYGLVREHHGRLFAESEPNAYTRFTMELPVETSGSLDT
jgi:signal transduction histidine kinase